MSRGPGRWQRSLLEALASSEGGVVVTHPDFSHSEQVALRRAAYKLEEAGRLVLTSEDVAGQRRLVAHRAENPVLAPAITTGLDGKRYRRTVATASEGVA